MKMLWNAIIKILVIIGGAWLFPEKVVCDSPQTMFFALIVMIITGFVLGLLILLQVILLDEHPIIMWGSLVITALASGFIQLAAAVHFVQGFEINGTMTYILLWLLIALFSVGNVNKGDKK